MPVLTEVLNFTKYRIYINRRYAFPVITELKQKQIFGGGSDALYVNKEPVAVLWREHTHI